VRVVVLWGVRCVAGCAVWGFQQKECKQGALSLKSWTDRGNARTASSGTKKKQKTGHGSVQGTKAGANKCGVRIAGALEEEQRD